MEEKRLEVSLDSNWQHQRAVSDEVILLKEKVASLERAREVQWRFISGVIVSVVVAIFYFGSQSATIMNNTQTLIKHDSRIRAIGPVINDAVGDVDAKISGHLDNHKKK